MIAGDCGAGAEKSEEDEGARRREPLIRNVYVAPGLQQPIPLTLFFSPWRIKYFTTLWFSPAKIQVFNHGVLKGNRVKLESGISRMFRETIMTSSNH